MDRRACDVAQVASLNYITMNYLHALAIQHPSPDMLHYPLSTLYHFCCPCAILTTPPNAKQHPPCQSRRWSPKVIVPPDSNTLALPSAPPHLRAQGNVAPLHIPRLPASLQWPCPCSPLTASTAHTCGRGYRAAIPRCWVAEN